MSNSYKRTPIVKWGRTLKDTYWSRIRSRWKTEINSGVHPEDVSHPKTIVNDYDHCDGSYYCKKENCRCVKKYGFKKCINK